MEHVDESENRARKRHRGGDAAKESDDLPKPPDGGWGYFVVLASFMIHIVTDGVTYSFGVFYLELLYYFEESKGTTAWIASILVGVTLCSGPISGSFVNKYGCRPVTIAGSILASLCLLASVWAQSVMMLYFTIGIGTGFGFGLIYLPAIVSVTCYFEKYRSLATGIAVCGSGLGTLVFAPYLEYLIREYGWRGAMMISSGIVLNCIVFGAVFRPLEHPKVKIETEGIPNNAKSASVEIQNPLELRPIREERYQQSQSTGNVNHLEPKSRFSKFDGDSKYENQANGNLRVTLSQPVLILRGNTFHHYHHNSQNQHQHHQQHHHRHHRFGENLSIRKPSFGSSGIMSRRDVLYQGSLDNLRKSSNFRDFHDPEELQSLKGLSNGNGIVAGENEEGCKAEEEEVEAEAEAAGEVLQKMLQLGLLKDPVFILFTFSNFCTSIGFNIPYVYLLPQAEEQGIPKEISSYLLAVIGVANTIGRIVLGYLSDKSWIDRLLVYNLCLTICGLSTALSTFCTSFATFAFYASVYGFTAGAYVGLTSVILVDLLGLNHLTNAFGLLLMFQGFASFLGPPIAGWLYDALKSYNPGFYVAGFTIAISGLMLFLVRPLQRRVERKEERRRRRRMNRIEISS